MAPGSTNGISANRRNAVSFSKEKECVMENTLSMSESGTSLSMPSSTVSRRVSMNRMDSANSYHACKPSGDLRSRASAPISKTFPSVPKFSMKCWYSIAVVSVEGKSPPKVYCNLKFGICKAIKMVKHPMMISSNKRCRSSTDAMRFQINAALILRRFEAYS